LRRTENKIEKQGWVHSFAVVAILLVGEAEHNLHSLAEVEDHNFVEVAILLAGVEDHNLVEAYHTENKTEKQVLDQNSAVLAEVAILVEVGPSLVEVAPILVEYKYSEFPISFTKWKVLILRILQ